MGSVALGFDGSPSARAALSMGEGPFKCAILGSTPHKILHISKVPVLCVAAESAGSRKASKMESTV
jgi:nucleotide-binding universal stress UspA family protein